jgi:hypothetical protein
VAYRLVYTLGPWAYVLLTYGTRGRVMKVLTLVAMVGYLYAAIVYQKRGLITYFALALVLWITMTPLQARVFGLRARLATAVGAILAFVAITWVGIGQADEDLLRRSVEELSERFESTIGDSAGSSEGSLTANERWQEAGWLLDDLHPLEVLFGRGFGSAFEVPWWWPPGRDVSVGGRSFWGLTECHVGFVMPILKGGIVFWLLYFYGWFYALGQFRRIRERPLAVACWGVIGLTFLSLSLEGQIGTQGVIQVFLLGFAIGVCGSRDMLAPVEAPAPAAVRRPRAAAPRPVEAVS